MNQKRLEVVRSGYEFASPSDRSGVANTGGPGDNGGMNDRLTALETRFDTVLPNLATRSDIGDLRAEIHKVDASLKTWMLGTVITIIGAMLAAIFGVSQIMRNTSAPSNASPAAPIILQIPAPTAPTPAAPVAQPAPPSQVTPKQ